MPFAAPELLPALPPPASVVTVSVETSTCRTTLFMLSATKTSVGTPGNVVQAMPAGKLNCAALPTPFCKPRPAPTAGLGAPPPASVATAPDVELMARMRWLLLSAM